MLLFHLSKQQGASTVVNQPRPWSVAVDVYFLLYYRKTSKILENKLIQIMAKIQCQ